MSEKLTYEELEKRVQELEQAESRRKRTEEALEKRILALTMPLDDAESINFEDLFNLEDIQRLQDEFAEANGVASLITYPDGTPITQPSNFYRLCSDIIRKTEKGLANCYKSDAAIGRISPDGPIIQVCMSGGFSDAGAAITVGGKHVANWLIGQVRDETQTEERMRAYAREIEADEDAVVEAFREVDSMPKEKFEQISRMLFTLAKQLSTTAYQTVQQARFITELKQAQDALKESETHLRTLIRTIPDLVWLKDQDGFYLFCNSKFERYFGAKEKDIIGKTDYDFVDNEQAAFFRKHDAMAIAIGEPRINEEEVTFADDGHSEILETIKTPMYTSDGRLAGVLGIGRDITDRKKAEEALRLNEARLETQLKLSQMTKESLKQISEFALEEAVGLTESRIGFLGFTGQDETVLAMGTWSKQTMEDCGVLEKPLEYPVCKEGLWSEVVRQRGPIVLNDHSALNFFKEGFPEGHVAVERLAIVPVFDGEKIVAVAGVGNKLKPYDDSDVRQLSLLMQGMWMIVKRQRAEEALRESEEKLARSKKMESLGLLAGGVAHDLNNVLSGIVNYPEVILLGLPEDSQMRKPVETIKDCGHRAAAIVQDLLTVARGVAISKDPLGINELADEYLLSPEFQKLNQYYPEITVKKELDKTLFNIDGSQVHIRKVIMNLVANACEAIEGSGNVTISTVNRYIDKPLKGYDDVNIGEYAVLSVSDDGPGISPDDLERIFEPFYTKKVMGRSGTGLGLAVVWNVVQDHKGYIDVISDKNGTTLELYFPITRNEIWKKDAPISVEDYKGSGEKILVVDDIDSQREIFCKLLEILGYQADSVPSGEDAVEYVKDHNVDLMLLDMIMDPGIDGRETYERVKKIQPKQKAIIVSGFAETDAVKEAQRMGVGRYIKKPVRLETLGLAIKEALRN
jgi:PAS domain S-box-containing protein